MSLRLVTKLGRTPLVTLVIQTVIFTLFVFIVILPNVVMPNAVVPLSILAAKNNNRDKHPSLFSPTVSDEEKKFI